MKFRQEKIQIGAEAEHTLESEVRSLAGSGDTDPKVPDTYWMNLPIRINSRIDEATSGKAMSISWALRVALPGAVAIVSFLIGLHYYVPEVPQKGDSISEIVLSLPPASLDSILNDPSRLDPPILVEELGPDVFDVSRTQIAEYLVFSGNLPAALDGLTNQETNELLAVLSSDGR
jgi:hypothetical protein